MRLCDIDPNVLRHAALMCARDESDPDMAATIMHLAVCPSDRVFYVEASAAEQLARIAA